MSSFLSHLEWRRAVKAFDPKRTITESDLEKILGAARMAPTSFGLQPFEVEIIQDKSLREKLKAQSWNQSQVTDASVLLVFVVRTDIKKRIDEYFDNLSGGSAEARLKLKDYESMMRGMLESRSEADLTAWAAKQAYISLGFAMAACAELEIDSCAMEGFAGPEFDKLLGFGPEKKSVVMLPLGYRDQSIPLTPQFRFSEKDLFKRTNE